MKENIVGKSIISIKKANEDDSAISIEKVKEKGLTISIEEVKKDESNIESIYFTYKENLESIKVYFNKFGNLASDEDVSINEKKLEVYTQAISEMEELSKEINNKKEEEVSTNQIDNNQEKTASIKEIKQYLTGIVYKIREHSKISPRNYEILSRSSFLMLNNYFEYLLADLLNYYYNKYKESLNSSVIKLTLKELNEYENIEEAIKDIIIKEVENLIVEKTFNGLLEHFENDLGISLEKNLINWDEIIEIRERRHLIVHNSSIVNKKYILRTGNPYNFKIGDIIHIDNNYFSNAWEQIKLAGQLLLFNCWGKWDKNNIDNAMNEIMMQTFENLQVKNYNHVSQLCKYCERLIPKNDIQEDYILRIKVNNAISLKKQDKDKELAKVLNEIKVGTAAPIFKIAHKILNDNHTDLEILFENSIIVDKLSLDSYLKWPIFDFVRENEDLNKKIIKIFEK